MLFLYLFVIFKNMEQTSFVIFKIFFFKLIKTIFQLLNCINNTHEQIYNLKQMILGLKNLNGQFLMP